MNKIFVLILIFVSSFHIYSTDKQNKDLLKFARKGDLESVQRLLSEGAEINIRSKDFGWTPLHFVLFGKDTPEKKDVFFFLMNSGADATIKNINDGTTLHMAATYDRTYAIEPLLNAGIDINVQNNNSATPLYLAAFMANTAALEILIDNGADVNIQTDNGNSPLIAACGDKNAEQIVEILINAKADLNLKNKKGMSALKTAEKKKILRYVELLKNAGAIE